MDTINELFINYLVLIKKKTNSCFDVKIRNSTIEQKLHVKYLGVVVLDEKLNWEEHGKNVTAKIAKGSRIILQLKHYVENIH